MNNDIVIEAWNTVLFEKFSRFKYLFVEGYASISEEILSRGLYKEDDHVLDIGCGFGDCTIAIAEQLGPNGKAIGVDCADNFVDASRAAANEASADCAEYFTADVENDSLFGPYDAAFARFGTMFFCRPGLAMRNIFASLKPGATFTQVVWRKREDNPWLHDAERCVREIVPVISHEETDEVHCGPGPFSMAGPDMVSDMLQSAGFERIQFERFDSDICIGRSIEEAIEFALQIGPAGEIIRLAGEAGEQLTPKVMEALQDVIGRYVKHDGSVWAPSSAWFITASKPKN